MTIDPKATSAGRAHSAINMENEIKLVHAAVEQAVKVTGLKVPGEQLRQMSLLPVIDADQDNDQGDGQAVAEVRGPGRPAGSRNRSTEEMKNYLLSKYRHPLEVLAETYSRPVGQLAAELDCSKKDAYGLQVAAAKELAPYVAQKQPLAVNIDQSGVVQLIIDPGLDMIDPNNDDGMIVIDAQDLTNKVEENQ